MTVVIRRENTPRLFSDHGSLSPLNRSIIEEYDVLDVEGYTKFESRYCPFRNFLWPEWV